MLSERRDTTAARRFFKRTVGTNGVPDRIAIDKSGANLAGRCLRPAAQIHDFNGFPDALYAEQYPAQGHPELAREVVSLLASHRAEEDDTWGLDYGAWAVLKYLYPEADVPVFQVSIDMAQGLAPQLEIGQALAARPGRAHSRFWQYRSQSAAAKF